MADYAAALLAQTRQFGEIIGAADQALPVPTCPGWSLQQLFRHLGRGHLWSAQIIRERRERPLDPRAVEGGKPPADREGALTWLVGSAHAVVDAVAEVGPDTPVWTFLGPRPAAWWIRRRLHEATVHRADAAIALGAAYVIDPALAADGLSEWLDILVAEVGSVRDHPLDAGSSLRLRATDLDAEWMLRIGPEGLSYQPTREPGHQAAHQESTAAARGRAADLLLAATRRKTATEAKVEILGDSDVWQGWLDRTPF